MRCDATDRALTVVIRRFERGAITPQSFQLHKENLLRMVSYCENTHECRCIARDTPARVVFALSHTHTPTLALTLIRRALQLSYFGETTFDRAQCKGAPHPSPSDFM